MSIHRGVSPAVVVRGRDIWNYVLTLFSEHHDASSILIRISEAEKEIIYM